MCVCCAHGTSSLKYVKSAKASTDVPTSVPEFISQRRRWLNGSLFASVHATVFWFRIWTSGQNFFRKIVEDATDFSILLLDLDGRIAMWNAGAEAVTIQGQRLISTTGIKCEGNQVTLHGIPYSPPYVIVGIGDPAAMESELTTDPILATYRDYTLVPGGGVSWDMARLDAAVAPPYEGLLDLTYATPLPS